MPEMASSSSTREEPPASTVVANHPPQPSTKGKTIVATGRDHCKQLKDMLNNEDPSTSSHQTSMPPSPPLMAPALLAVASSGSGMKLQAFINGDPLPTSSNGTVRCCCFSWSTRKSFPPAEPHPTSGDEAIRSSSLQPPSSDLEAHLGEAILDGVTFEGDTFLHVMATNSARDDLIEDGHIRSKAVQFLSRQNKNGDTPLHSAARAAKPQMLSFLIDLARGNDADTVKALLETENNSRWTVLHEAVRAGSNDMVNLLMTGDQELASLPNDDISPLYLAILLGRKTIAETLHQMSGGELSYSGPNGQNALHAAVLRGKDLTEMLLGWNNALTKQQDDNGSTPLHMAASARHQRDLRAIRLFLLKANPNALYQPDHEGSFPIHVAASINASYAVSDYIKNSPDCAGLRDARGRTFLHVAAETMQRWIVYSACKNRSLSWILNMQDHDGNTALHLAVQVESLIMSCALIANGKVHLNLTNGKRETPLDIALFNCAKRNFNLNHMQNSEVKIRNALRIANAKRGICRQDYYEKNDILHRRQGEIRQTEMVNDATQNLCIGSVLVATVTFGATFAMPGGYRADDHPNGGTPTRAGRSDFDAFTVANTLAFTFSTIATASLLSSGSPMRNTRVRVVHFHVAYYCMSIAIKCLVSAFAIGTYTVLAPVAHKTAVGVCAMSSLVLLNPMLELIIKNIVMLPPLCLRRGKVFTFNWFMSFLLVNILIEYWTIIVIFCSTLRSYPSGKVESEIQPSTSSP